MVHTWKMTSMIQSRFLIHFSNSFTCWPLSPSCSHLTLKIEPSLAVAFSWALHILFHWYSFVPMLPFARNMLVFSSLLVKYLGLFIKFMSNLSLQVCFLGKCLIFSGRVRWFCTQCSFGIACLPLLLEKTHILFPPMPKRDKTSSAFNTLRINRTALLLPGFNQGEGLAGQLGHSDT